MPEAREALASGALPLTAAASVQRFVRREEKCSGVKVSQDRKRELVEQCAGLSSREVERVLALIDWAREVHGDLPLGELFRRALQTHLGKTDPLRKAERAADRVKARAQRAATPAPEVGRESDPGRSRYLPAPARHAAQARAQGRCEWRDSATGARCLSRHRLEYDHVEPFAAPYLRERPLEHPAGGFASRS